MANEFKHKDPGSALTQAEFIASDGTGHIFESQAQGDVLYASSATVLARLGKDANATRALTNTGTNNNPAWAQIALATGVSGTLPAGNGGTGITSLGTNVATFLGTPSSANLRSALTDETGTGEAVFATSPTLVTPALGTPASGVLTNATGLPIAGIANGTDGELITWNASGVAAAVAVGSADEVLTSNGSGAAPTFQAAAAGATLSGTTDNTIVTVTGANAMAGEANLTFSTDLTITGGNVVIGTAGKGIDFSNQASPASGMTSELLDHYEEGTWTPTIGDSTQNGTSESQGYSIQVGRYTKIGNRVFITCHITISSLGSMTTDSATYLMGLPFTSNTTSNNRSAVHCGGTSSLAVAAGTTVTGHIEPNNVFATLMLYDSVEGTTNLLVSEISVNGNMAFSGHYEV
jgi:hypothetical protein